MLRPLCPELFGRFHRFSHVSWLVLDSGGERWWCYAQQATGSLGVVRGVIKQ